MNINDLLNSTESQPPSVAERGIANAMLACHLALHKRVTISNYIAHLQKGTQAQVVLGGLFQYQSKNVVGPLPPRCIEQVHFSKAFIGVDGFHLEVGFTGLDMMRADVVNSVLITDDALLAHRHIALHCVAI